LWGNGFGRFSGNEFVPKRIEMGNLIGFAAAVVGQAGSGWQTSSYAWPSSFRKKADGEFVDFLKRWVEFNRTENW
jgi:hypothetical protein